MRRTIYSAMTTEELIDFALQRDNVSEMEVELAQRLYVAMGMLEDVNGANAGSESEGSRQKAVN
jgi:ABC-type branched-subunit amino acid transport system ATPase component